MPLGRAFAFLFGFCLVICFLALIAVKNFVPRPEPAPTVAEAPATATSAQTPLPAKSPAKVPQPGELAAEFKRTHANKATPHGVILPDSIAETSDLRSVEYCTSQDLWFRADWTHDGKDYVFALPRQIPAPSNPTAWHRDVVDPIPQWKELTANEVAKAEADLSQAGTKVKEVEEQIELARKGIIILNAPEEIRKTAKGPLWVFPSEPARQRRIVDLKTNALPKVTQAYQAKEMVLKQLRSRGMIVPPLRVSELAINKAGRLVTDQGEPIKAKVEQVLDTKSAAVHLGNLTAILEGDASRYVDGGTVVLPPVQVVGTRLYRDAVVFRLVLVSPPKTDPTN